MAVFVGMYPQLLSFQEGIVPGVPTNQSLSKIQTMFSRGDVTQEPLQAWIDVGQGLRANDTNKIWNEQALFAKVEQYETLQAV